MMLARLRRFVTSRTFLQIGILVPMALIANASPDVFTALIGLALIPLAGFQIGAWLYLRAKSSLATDLGFDLPTLRSRVDDALTLAQASTAAAVAGAAVILRGASLIGVLPRWFYVVIIGYVMIIIAIPAAGWLRQWRRSWLPSLRTAAQARADAPQPAQDAPGDAPTDPDAQSGTGR